MKLPRIARYLMIALTVAVAAAIFLVLFRFRDYPRLPYRDSFAKRQAGEWAPMGGSWRVVRDEMINRSDEPGAKLITGSSHWSDYQIVSDLMLRAHGGDIGVVLRVNDPEIGIDAYRGYYVGLRSGDSSIVIGRADHSWLEARPIAVTDGVQVGVWYRLKVVIVGCEMAAEATNLSSGQTNYAAMRDATGDCIARGKIGLRSTDTSGAWKNVQVSAATHDDLQQILEHGTSVGKPEYPIREDDYARMREQYFPDYPSGLLAMLIDPSGVTKLPLVSAESLQTNGYSGARVRLRGVVTFTEPVYLQDETGGIMLQARDPESLNIGDDIEVIGRAVTGGFSPVFTASSTQLLSERTLLSPISITPTEAASGTHSGSLVEVTGVIKSRTRRADGGIVLELAESAQDFAVKLESDLFGNVSRGWTVGSTIRVHGICSLSPEVSPTDSFTILVASASDISVISGPPWWSGWRLVRILGLCLLVILALFHAFLQFERSKHRAIMQEREHLAHEMHDTLAQSFVGVGYYLQSIRRSLREEETVPARAMEQLDVACEMVTETHREASASIAALHPETHDDDGDLLTLLERSTFSMLGGECLPIVLCREGDERTLPPTITNVLFHVGREAISNVLRHARATSIKLTLQFHARQASLSIEDNGAGYVADSHKPGFGLQSMMRRCREIGADLAITTSPGHGCKVTVTAPYRRRVSISKWLSMYFRLR
jgi:two-component sensor histidine kinase